MSKTAAYVFTWNNYPDSCHEMLQRLKFTYLVYGEEIAPSTGTPHLQGFIRFTSARTIKAIQKDMKPHAFSFLEKAYAVPDEYCKKDGKYHEFGEKPAQGARNDLDKIQTCLQFRDTDIRQLINEGRIQNYQQLKFAEALQKYSPLYYRDSVTILWFHGRSGTGKTREALTYPDPYIADLGNWYDGYSGQETLILDDFRYDTMKFNDLLRLIDRYPRRLNVKCSSTQLKATTIIITAPDHPRCMFGFSEEDWLDVGHVAWQLNRRITKIKCFDIL